MTDTKTLIEETNQKIESIKLLILPYQQEISSLIKQKEHLQEKLDLDNLEAVESASHIEKWNFFINEPEGSNALYDARVKFYNQSGFVYSFFVRKNQYIPTVYINKNRDNVDKVYEELTLIKDIFNVDSNGRVIFDIMEHTCSEHGSYYLVYTPKTQQWAICTHVGLSLGYDIFSSDNLKHILNYIGGNHPVDIDDDF